MSASYAMRALIRKYIEHLTVRQYASSHLEGRERQLGYFADWCEERNVVRIHDVTRALIERYQQHLFYYRRANGKPLTAHAQYNRICGIRMFFKWAARERIIEHSPAADLELPRLPTMLPRDVLSPREAEQVLSQPDIRDVYGLRDRAILEVFYSTGMRRTELCRLLLHDVSHDRGTAMIREGKGRRDRVVPIGERALKWIDKYVNESRVHLVVEPDPQTLFIGMHGDPVHPDYLSRMVSEYIVASKIGKTGSCHLFRHTVATAMLENGADIRFIQAMLGHAKLETTSIYTRVSIAKLKEVHSSTHPAERKDPVTTEEPPPITPEQLLSELHEEALSDES